MPESDLIGRAMTTFVNTINIAATVAFSWLLLPFRGLNPLWAIAVVSLICGVTMLWIFGKVSNQSAIRIVRERIRGNLLAVRLYQHDVGVVLRLQLAILTDTGLYLRYSLLPVLVLFVPVVLILAQLNLYFDLRPLRPGEKTLVKVKVQDPSEVADLELKVPEGVAIEIPPVRLESEKEVVWRIRATASGQHTVTVVCDTSEVAKSLAVGEKWMMVPSLATRSVLDGILFPGEPLIGSGGCIESIEIGYRPAELELLGWNVHWLLLFLVLSIASAFLFKRPLGIEF